jgi:predicted site-specific integrase-resolvase
MPSTNGHGSRPERIALYLRVSSEEQRDAGTIQTQRDYLGRYAAEHGFEVVEVYTDDGVSGTFLLHERPEGLRLFEDAREGGFQTVLVCHDEVVVECDAEKPAEVEAWLKKAMIEGMDAVMNGTDDVQVPAEVEAWIAKSWGEAG